MSRPRSAAARLAPLVFLASSAFACGGGSADSAESAPPASDAAAPPPAAVETPVTAVSACTVLTADEVQSVYAGKQFAVESRRDDPPTPYEALSACRYSEGGSDDPMIYHVDLEIRAKPDAEQARRFLTDAKEMDPQGKARDVTGLGDGAVFFDYSMAGGGPQLAFVQGPVFYRLTIQTLSRGALNTTEAELNTLAGLVLAPPQ
jgi:hypothetical protein